MAITNVKNLFGNFRGDLFGGITAGVIALPLALAFGVASGAGAAAGLYGAILVGFFASLFGGTKPQVSGPTGPMTVVLASIIALHPGNFKVIFFTIILAGLFQILLGVLKIGKLIRYVPYPVISGFMSGIGVIIIILQINPLFGLGIEGNTINSLVNFFNNIGAANIHAIILGLITLSIVFLTPQKIAKNVPPSLTALIFVTMLSVFLGWDVATIGEIPTSLPSFNLPLVPIQDLRYIIPFAITLSILGSVDSLLTSLAVDSLTKTNHNPDKELIGQGIGNMMAGLFGGICGAGATMRTVVNIKTGGKTPLAGIIHSIFLVLVLIWLAPYAKFIPMTVLAGILIKVGFDIIDYKFIKVIRHAPKRDLAVMLLVFGLTVFDDLIFAVGAGIVLSSLLFALSVSEQMEVQIQDVSSEPGADDDTCCTGECIEKASNYRIRTVDIEGVFFFGSTSRILTRVDDFLDTEYLIINCKQIKDMDISAAFALQDIVHRLKDKNIHIMLVLNNPKLMKKLLRLNVVEVIGKDNIFYSKTEAINTAKKLIYKKVNKSD